MGLGQSLFLWGNLLEKVGRKNDAFRGLDLGDASVGMGIDNISRYHNCKIFLLKGKLQSVGESTNRGGGNCKDSRLIKKLIHNFKPPNQ
jgi:hypothetical protein